MARTVRTRKKRKAAQSSATESCSTRRDAKKKKFLDALIEGASILEACRTAGVGRQTVYDWRSTDADFAKDWEQALAFGTWVLEQEAYSRAIDHSDTLLIFLLKARLPEKYCDKTRALKQAEGGDIPLHKIDIASLSEKQLTDLINRISESLGYQPDDEGRGVH